MWLERLRIDDAVGAVPVHLAAGIWGTLATGLLGDGDAYMVVSGLPDPRPDFTRAVANMGLAMVAFCDEFLAACGISVRLRVGIHVGPVVGGVIGRRRFIFDVWGDTVNIASRMESTSEPGKVQVSEAAMNKIATEHMIEPRGEVEVKGMGLMQTYWLKDRRPPERQRKDSRDVARQSMTAERVATIDEKPMGMLRPWLWPEEKKAAELARALQVAAAQVRFQRGRVERATGRGGEQLVDGAQGAMGVDVGAQPAQ